MILFLAGVPFMEMRQPAIGRYHMWNQMMSYGWGWMGLGMVLFWALVILGIAALVKSLVSAPPTENVLDILMVRYARGEIGHEEFEQKKSDLSP